MPHRKSIDDFDEHGKPHAKFWGGKEAKQFRLLPDALSVLGFTDAFGVN
jgi:hypothetical protein